MTLMFMIIMMLFLCLSHPLAMIIQTILMTLMVAWSMSEIMTNSWMSLILVLVWLGGLLIIFTYLSSLVPNEMMTISWKVSIFMLLLVPFLNMNMMKSEMFFLKKMFLFSLYSYNLFIPLILTLLMLMLTVAIFLTSFLKTPNKQEMN